MEEKVMERLEECAEKDLEDDAQMAEYTQWRAAEIRAAIQQRNVKEAQALLSAVFLLPEPYPRWVIEKLNKKRKTGPKGDRMLKLGLRLADQIRQILREVYPGWRQEKHDPSPERMAAYFYKRMHAALRASEPAGSRADIYFGFPPLDPEKFEDRLKTTRDKRGRPKAG
jgi:hypothetical protein